MREVKDVTITEEGRDKGKIFRITEMSASAAEEWAARALLAVTKSGLDIGDAAGTGMAGIAVLGLQSFYRLGFEDIKPLMDEMFKCIAIVPDTKNLVFARPLIEEDIQEVKTRIRLRAEVFTLHTGFSLAEMSLTSISAQKKKRFTRTKMSRKR